VSDRPLPLPRGAGLPGRAVARSMRRRGACPETSDSCRGDLRLRLGILASKAEAPDRFGEAGLIRCEKPPAIDHVDERLVDDELHPLVELDASRATTTAFREFRLCRSHFLHFYACVKHILVQVYLRVRTHATDRLRTR
jgi:hypothetical protein